MLPGFFVYVSLKVFFVNFSRSETSDVILWPDFEWNNHSHPYLDLVKIFFFSFLCGTFFYVFTMITQDFRFHLDHLDVFYNYNIGTLTFSLSLYICLGIYFVSALDFLFIKFSKKSYYIPFISILILLSVFLALYLSMSFPLYILANSPPIPVVYLHSVVCDGGLISSTLTIVNTLPDSLALLDFWISDETRPSNKVDYPIVLISNQTSNVSLVFLHANSTQLTVRTNLGHLNLPLICNNSAYYIGYPKSLSS